MLSPFPAPRRWTREEEERLVLGLEVERLNWRQIALLLDRSVGSVKQHWYQLLRAGRLEAIRQRLGLEGGQGE